MGIFHKTFTVEEIWVGGDLAWFTGAAVISASMPSPKIIIIATLYAIGAHGIMTLNEFKALEGDRQTGISSLPVLLDPRLAALIACITMAIHQFIVVLLLYIWIGPSLYGIAISALILGRVWAMQIMMRDPKSQSTLV